MSINIKYIIIFMIIFYIGKVYNISILYDNSVKDKDVKRVNDVSEFIFSMCNCSIKNEVKIFSKNSIEIKKYIKDDNKSVHAFYNFNKNIIVFDEEFFNPNIIIHEFFHYISSENGIKYDYRNNILEAVDYDYKKYIYNTNDKNLDDVRPYWLSNIKEFGAKIFEMFFNSSNDIYIYVSNTKYKYVKVDTEIFLKKNASKSYRVLLDIFSKKNICNVDSLKVYVELCYNPSIYYIVFSVIFMLGIPTSVKIFYNIVPNYYSVLYYITYSMIIFILSTKLYGFQINIYSVYILVNVSIINIIIYILVSNKN